MTSNLEHPPLVNDQSVLMDDDSFPILQNDEQRCNTIKAFEKEVKIFSARKDYVAEMVQIETKDEHPNQETVSKLQEELKTLENKVLFLEGKVTESLPCPVALCNHNFKYRSTKRHADPIIRAGKLTQLNNKRNLKTNDITDKDLKDFTFPKKTVKAVPQENSQKTIPMQNSYAALNTAKTDAEDVTPVINKTKPISMKMNNRYTQILQELHRTHPTATNSYFNGYIKIQAETPDHHREITNYLTTQKVEYFVTDPIANRPLKLVIKGLPADTKIEDIKADLISKGIKIDKVAQLKRFSDKTPLPIFMIEVVRDENVEDIHMASIYYPPGSSSRLGDDLDIIFNLNKPAILMGDFNAKHTSWGCSRSETRGNRLYSYINRKNIDLFAPTTPTRYGTASASIIDYALLKNINWPCTIDSIPELSSDHNPVKLLFPKTSKFNFPPPQLNTTWSTFTNILSNVDNFNLPNACSTHEIDSQVSNLTKDILHAHACSSKPFNKPEQPFVQGELKQLFKDRNKARKIWQTSRHPQHKTDLNRIQNIIKRKVNEYRQQVWEDNLTSLNTEDNSLWGAAKAFRRKAAPISALNGPAEPFQLKLTKPTPKINP
ncbi:uncharacterized protein TNCT_140391 [Trichonephila clavata]|uniref:Endonuclease/exonuclease/phosphatase domain-containing protein n=1 Tax=Trichonephila clavata TaxID=2740835 RepID=A0A8X6F4A9_TRICU|nr:uncharacterized protein TNCT_140391 [Trichonephila clavata]